MKLSDEITTSATAVPETAGEDASGQASALDRVLAGASPRDEGPAAVSAELKAVLEALIFASPEPLGVKALRKLLEGEAPEQIDAAIAALRTEYNDGARGLQIVEVAGGYQIVTRPELHEWVRRLFHERTTQKLSVQALETLAVIAYKQPVTAAEIAEIRGVNTAGVLGTLIDRKLIRIAGRKQVVGRPFTYATTREFLERFGLRDLAELPKVEDLADALGFEPPALSDAAADLPLPFEAEASAPVEDSAPPSDPDAGNPELPEPSDSPTS